MLQTSLQVNFKIYDITNWEANNYNTVHKLQDISRSKCNQIMTFDQLMKYIMGTIVLEKLCTKCGGETCPILFFRKD